MNEEETSDEKPGIVFTKTEYKTLSKQLGRHSKMLYFLGVSIIFLIVVLLYLVIRIIPTLAK